MLSDISVLGCLPCHYNISHPVLEDQNTHSHRHVLDVNQLVTVCVIVGSLSTLVSIIGSGTAVPLYSDLPVEFWFLLVDFFLVVFFLVQFSSVGFVFQYNWFVLGLQWKQLPLMILLINIDLPVVLLAPM